MKPIAAIIILSSLVVGNSTEIRKVESSLKSGKLAEANRK